MARALVAGAVAEEGDHHAVVALHLAAHCRAHRDRKRRSDDTGLAENPYVKVCKVHRATLALAVAGCLAEKLCHSAPHIPALGYGMPMRTVVASDIIVVPQGGAGSHGNGFLTNVAVRHPHKLAALDKLLDILLELADQHHPPEHQHVKVSFLVHFSLH